MSSRDNIPVPTPEEIKEARSFFPTMTDEQLVGLIEATDYFQNKLLDDYLGLNDYEEERYCTIV